MIPPYLHSVMPLDLNQDHQSHELFTPNPHASPNSFSSLSSSYPNILFNPPHQDQHGSHYWEPTKHLPSDENQEEKIGPSRGSWDDSGREGEKSRKKEERSETTIVEGGYEEGCSVKWMSSKMRMMRKMMVSDEEAGNSTRKFEEDKKQAPSISTDDNIISCNNYSNHQSTNNTVRVCADCNTTKTPLWRSGPKGPKSLCNACGIRQRKARRAAAAAAAVAAGNGRNVESESERSRSWVKGNNKLEKKEKRSRSNSECGGAKMKKTRKLKGAQSRSKFGFEDLTLRLSNKLALHHVFPQDEKDAAILLMALSYGLVHG